MPKSSPKLVSVMTSVGDVVRDGDTSMSSLSMRFIVFGLLDDQSMKQKYKNAISVDGIIDYIESNIGSVQTIMDVSSGRGSGKEGEGESEGGEGSDRILCIDVNNVRIDSDKFPIYLTDTIFIEPVVTDYKLPSLGVKRTSRKYMRMARRRARERLETQNKGQSEGQSEGQS